MQLEAGEVSPRVCSGPRNLFQGTHFEGRQREDMKLGTPLVCPKLSIDAGVAHLQCHLGKW